MPRSVHTARVSSSHTGALARPQARAAPAVACTGKKFAKFSAVCWYFGKNVFQSLHGKVPLGAPAVGRAHS